MNTARRPEESDDAVRTPAAHGCDDRELVRLATLAASSHNTQPWMFRVEPDAITILPDRSRRCPTVDPDDAHLFRSLGCAAENLVHAASTQRLAAEVRYDESTEAIVVGLRPGEGVGPSPLASAITTRQSTRLPFDGTTLTDDELELLAHAGVGDYARPVIVTEPARLAAISDLVARGNEAQLSDPAFRRELLSWIRFNAAAAERTRDGLAGRCSGNPSLPTWLARPLSRLILRPSTQIERDTEALRSSAGVVVLVSTRNDSTGWVDAGRACQRLALQAAALDIRTAFINQPIEVPSLRPELESLLGIENEHAQLAMRFGHGPLAPYSLRRPVDEVTC